MTDEESSIIDLYPSGEARMIKFVLFNEFYL